MCTTLYCLHHNPVTTCIKSTPCFSIHGYNKGKASPYSITERRVPELIPVLGSQPAGDVSQNPAVGCHYFPPGPQLPSQPLRGLLPISLLSEQSHDGCDSLPKTVTRQRRDCDLNPGPTAPESSTLTTRLPSHPSGYGHQCFDMFHATRERIVHKSNLLKVTKATYALNYN